MSTSIRKQLSGIKLAEYNEIIISNIKLLMMMKVAMQCIYA